jgi:hypothetical protein
MYRIAKHILIILIILVIVACKKWEDPFTESSRILFTIETEETWTPTSDLLSICYVNDKFLFSLDYTDRNFKPISSGDGKTIFYSYLDTLRCIDLTRNAKRTLNIYGFQKVVSNFDGSRIAFIKDYTDLYIYDSYSGASTLIYTGVISGLYNNVEPWLDITSSGNRVLCVYRDIIEQASKIMVMNSDGGNQTICSMVYGYNKHFKFPFFSNDESTIYFIYDDEYLFKCSATGGIAEQVYWDSYSFSSMGQSGYSFISLQYLHDADKIYYSRQQFDFLIDPTKTGDNAKFSYIFTQAYSFESVASSNGKLIACTNELGKDRSKRTGTKNLWVFPFSDDEDHTYRLLVPNCNCTRISFISDIN